MKTDSPARTSKARNYRPLLLLSLLLFCALGALAFGMTRSQSASVAKRQIEAQGGYVLSKHRGPQWFINILGDASPFKTTEIIRFGPKTTDDDLSLAVMLKQARSVFLEGCRVTGPGLAHLKHLRGLEYIAL